MVERRIGIVAVLLCISVLLLPVRGLAASTTDAKEPIDPAKTCTLTLSYSYDGTAFADVAVKLYRVAEISADFQYTLTSAFAASGLILNGVQTNGEWDVIRSTLEAHILAYGVEPDLTVLTDQAGQACFDALKTGLFLAVIGNVTQGELSCNFDSALVSLPGLGEDGRWQYQVAVAAKAELLPPGGTEDEIQLKILKLWKDDDGRNTRPGSVEVEIFRDGVSSRTVVLSEENHWSYSWTAKDDGASWMVVERNVPDGYSVTVEKRGTSFLLTNTLEDPDGTKDPPKTGDPTNVWRYIVLMVLSGGGLIILGIVGKRRSK